MQTICSCVWLPVLTSVLAAVHVTCVQESPLFFKALAPISKYRRDMGHLPTLFVENVSGIVFRRSDSDLKVLSRRPLPCATAQPVEYSTAAGQCPEDMSVAGSPSRAACRGKSVGSSRS